MLARTHIAAGVALAALTAALAHRPEAPALLALGGLGGLAPDLDHPQALLTRHLPGASALAGAATAAGLVRHRGALHSWALWAAAAFLAEPALAAWLARVWWALGVGIGHPAWVLAAWRAWGADGRWGWAAGYASHLLVDTLNTTGVQWFWPLLGWKVHSPIPNIPVGSPGEMLFRWGLYAGMALWRPWLGLAVLVASELVYRGVQRL